MDTIEKWSLELRNAGRLLPELENISSAASAFNANIDAIVNIDGRVLSELLKKRAVSRQFLQHYKARNAETFDEALCGIFKCFSAGIAEEWTSSNPNLCGEILDIFKPKKMQIGGQGGIIANLLSICKIQNVAVHTNSLPKIQSAQFLPHKNLRGFDENGNTKQISQICRSKDVPLIHIIFEFQKDDEIIVDDKIFVCPKSNRFIMSCDELNQKLITDENFMQYMAKNPQNYCFLSGFHLLTSKNAQNVLPKIKNEMIKWKLDAQKDCILHLEIASTSDNKVLKMIIDEIAQNVDSIGLNEREAIDVMQILNPQEIFAPAAVDMFKAMLLLRQYTKAPRIELHMLGIFMTIQDKKFKQTPIQAKNGMLLAARISASRAKLGDLKKYDLIAVPTALVKKPTGLVGMGDTISSISLVGAV